MKNHQNPFHTQAFTLVELIVVITILAILGTIGFISLQGYSSKSRDSTRVSHLSLVARSLEIYQVNAGRYPSPDTITGTGQIGGVTIALTGVFGDSLASLIKLDKAPKDPLSGNNLAYWVDISNKQYQIAATLEWTLVYNEETDKFYASTSSILAETLIPTVHAAGAQGVKVSGNYQGVMRATNTLYNPPALIFASGSAFTAWTIDLASTNTRFITNNGANIPYAIQDAIQGATTPVQSLAAIGSTASSLTGIVLTDWSTQSGSLATTLGFPKDAIGIAYYGVKEYAKIQLGGNGGGGGTSTDWRNVDANCTKPDVVIGTQTWAGCNSTVGTGLDYNQANCYDYAWTTKTCTAPPSWKTASTMTELDYQAWQSSNIYGKLYTFAQAPAACTTGYHLPTNAEWDTLMANLGCSGGNKLTGDTAWWECTTNTSDTTNWLGWTSTNPNSLKIRLWLTLAGYCNGGSCNLRGNGAYYWSSSVYAPSPTSGWDRYLYSAFSSVNRHADSQSNAFSVRCVKD